LNYNFPTYIYDILEKLKGILRGFWKEEEGDIDPICELPIGILFLNRKSGLNIVCFNKYLMEDARHYTMGWRFADLDWTLIIVASKA
jgi:hypothetical protein